MTSSPPEDRDRFREFNERICEGEKGSLEFDIVGLKGARRHMETHAAPLRHLDGTTVHLAITRDITERKRAERAALLLSAIVDSSDDAIISKDLNGVITSWNKSAERLFGYTAAEAIGQTVAAMLIPADRLDEEPEILARLRRGERVDHFETVRRRKDGTLLDISLTISPVKDQRRAYHRRIEDRPRHYSAQEVPSSVCSKQARLLDLRTAMPQILCVTARPDRLSSIGIERGRRCTASPARRPWARFRTNSADRVSGAVAGNSGDTFARRPLVGRTHAHIVALVPESMARFALGSERDAEGERDPHIGIEHRHRRAKRVQEELRRANQDLEQFAFSASHDLQEPLRSVKIYSELLAKRHGERLDEEAQKFVTFVRNGATRMEMLVRDLLTYTQVTKFEAARRDRRRERSPEQRPRQPVGRYFGKRRARSRADPLPSLPVHGTHLQQLFQNLIGNAIKYRSPERPPVVHVSCRAAERTLDIRRERQRHRHRPRV